MKVNGCNVKCLVDTGCSKSVVICDLVPNGAILNSRKRIVMMNGTSIEIMGQACCEVGVGEKKCMLDCLIVGKMVPGVQMIFGMDGIVSFGGLKIDENGKLVLNGVINAEMDCTSGCVSDSSCLTIDDENFSAAFENGKWVVKWKWKNDVPPAVLENDIAQYRMEDGVRERFESTLDDWIKKGYLILYDEQCFGQPKGLIPMFPVVQPNKDKVRPVFDFRELNKYVVVYSAKSDVCNEKLRMWRKCGTQCAIIDLKDAYLQLNVDKSLWCYQTVKHRGKLWCLTRLGFGLNAAPLVMSKVLGKVLSLDPLIESATDSFVDDIFVDISRVPDERVQSHLLNYGLLAKATEFILEGSSTRVLGLDVTSVGNKLFWKRSASIESIVDLNKVFLLTKRELYSVCGKLTGIYPVANWLRIACSYLKRATNDIKWDDIISYRLAKQIEELLLRLQNEDPVKGRWDVRKTDSITLWCDASNLAIGAVLQVNDSVIEDASWLRKDVAHTIIMAEFDAVIKGLNLCLLWQMKKILIKTDSAIAAGWLKDLISGCHQDKGFIGNVDSEAFGVNQICD